MNKDTKIIATTGGGFGVPVLQRIGDLNSPIGIETTNNFIARHLIEAGHTVSNIPSLCVKRSCERMDDRFAEGPDKGPLPSRRHSAP